MNRKILSAGLLIAAAYLSAQDISTIRNTVELYSNPEISTSVRLAGMAGANGAAGGEASSMISNPAGLGVAISSSVAASLSMDHYQNTSAFGESSRYYSASVIGPSNLSGLLSFKMKEGNPWKFMNVGINVSHQTLDNYIETPGDNLTFYKSLIDVNNAPHTGKLTLDRHAYDRTGSVTHTAVGIGGNYADRLYIGASLLMSNSTLEQHDMAQFGLDLDNTHDLFSKQYTPFAERASGVGLSVGVLGKVNKNFRLGASIQTPMYTYITRSFTEYTTDAAGYMVSNAYSEERDFYSPWKAGVSAAWVYGKNFSANLDYKATLGRPHFATSGAANQELNSFFKSYYQPQHEVNLGAEYRINKFRVRAGYGFVSSPLKSISISTITSANSDATVSYTDLISGKRSFGTVGLGYDWKSFFLDVAYRHTSTQFSNPFLFGETDGEYSTGYHSGNYDVATAAFATSAVTSKRNQFTVGVGWKF